MSHLCIKRKPGQSFVILTSDGPIEVTYLRQAGGGIAQGIRAPEHVKILRSELVERDAQGGKR